MQQDNEDQVTEDQVTETEQQSDGPDDHVVVMVKGKARQRCARGSTQHKHYESRGYVEADDKDDDTDD